MKIYVCKCCKEEIYSNEQCECRECGNVICEGCNTDKHVCVDCYSNIYPVFDDYNKIQRRYEFYGVSDYQLKNKKDLKNVLNVEVDLLDEVDTLDEEEKEICVEFLLNFFNAHGLEARERIKAKAFYFAREEEVIADSNIDEGYVETISLKVYNDTKNRLIRDYKKSKNEKNVKMETARKTVKRYYRFEYEEHDRRTFLHVDSVDQWW